LGNLYRAAEIAEPLDKAVDGLGLVMPVKAGRSGVALFDPVAEHVVGGDQHRGYDSEDRFLRAATCLDAKEPGAKVGVLATRRGTDRLIFTSAAAGACTRYDRKLWMGVN